MKSYIPPHRRNEIKNGVNKLIDYPEFIKTKNKELKSLNYKDIFKSVSLKKKKKELKKGWIKLTKMGIFDSLTEEENQNIENKLKEDNIKKCLKKLLTNYEKYKQEFYDIEGYEQEEYEEYEEYEEEEYEEEEDDEEEYDELLDIESELYDEQKYKWATM